MSNGGIIGKVNAGRSGLWGVEDVLFSKNLISENVIGVCMVSHGGGEGAWKHINLAGNDFVPDADFFNLHPTYSGISPVTIDGQAMIRFPKHYFRADIAPVESPYAGKPCYWISDAPFLGFRVVPCFMKDGVEVDEIFIGAYENSSDGETKAASLPGRSPLVYTTFPQMKSRCEARGDGFRLWDIYQQSMIARLILIEMGTPDVQSVIGAGNSDSGGAVITGNTNATWRGLHELWGNVLMMCDGLTEDTSNHLKIWDTQGCRTWVNTGETAVTCGCWTLEMFSSYGVDWDLSACFIPKVTTTNSADESFSDQYWPPQDGIGNNNICDVGGHWMHKSSAGIFAKRLYAVASDSTFSLGGRMAKV